MYKFTKIIIDENIVEPINQNLFDLISNTLQLEDLENRTKGELNISTITSTCCIKGVTFNCENIAKYIDLADDCIISVSQNGGHKTLNNDSKSINRSLMSKKRQTLKARKKMNFFNQVSMYVQIDSKKKTDTKKTNHVHVKLFSNGSIQLAGCRNAMNIYEVLAKIINKMKQTKAIIVNNIIEEKPFVTDINALNINNVDNFKVSMINTNFTFGEGVVFNLSKLHMLLTSFGHQCVYDKIKHSCVNLTYLINGEKTSIFIFEKGSVVITGGNNGPQIYRGFSFITKLIYSKYAEIKKIEIDV